MTKLQSSLDKSWGQRHARYDYRPPIVIDAVAVRRLYEIAVVDFKSSHFHAIGIIDDAVLCVLRRRYFYPFYRVFFVSQADTNIIAICGFEILHKR